MATEVSICNMALARIGVRKAITSLTSAGTEAETCNLFYAQVRDEVLSTFDWPFARRRAELALVSGDARDEWSYVYAMPGDALRARAIVTGLSNPAPKDRIPFELEANSALTGRVILTNQEEAVLQYTAKVTDPAAFDPIFTKALTWAMAAELALAIPAKANLENVMRQRYAMALAEAKVATLHERRRDEAPDSEFITERG